MAVSTWWNITHGMTSATYKGYMSKTSRQRRKREVDEVWKRRDDFCRDMERELADGSYRIGEYRHFTLHDKKKERDISVLPFRDRCVQNCVKDAIEPLVLRQMTDDMLGGLPGRGVVASDARHSVVRRVRRAMNDHSLRYYMQADIRKFYDNIDNVVTMRLLERKVSDRRTLAVIRQHLFNQRKLAIGDPFSHLLANLNMSVVIRKAKERYGARVTLVNFADDLLAFARDMGTLASLRGDLNRWARQQRMKYKRMYICPMPTNADDTITFCGYQFGRGFVRLTQRTKKRYVRARHRRRSMGSYNGLLQVADTKNLRHLVELKDNRHMADKIRTRFTGKPMKVEQLEGVVHHVVDKEEKPSRERHSSTYWHVQAIAEGLGLIVYSTSSIKLTEVLAREQLPVRNLVIRHDWRGYYYEGTVYTDEEEEAMIRERFNIY